MALAAVLTFGYLRLTSTPVKPAVPDAIVYDEVAAYLDLPMENLLDWQIEFVSDSSDSTSPRQMTLHVFHTGKMTTLSGSCEKVPDNILCKFKTIGQVRL